MTITNTTSGTDRIEKQIVLRSPRARVWRAVSDAKEFGEWFGVAFDGAFAPGARLKGRVTRPEEYAGLTFEVIVERVEPERLLSYRWHPNAHEPGVDYSKEPTTLVAFELESHPEGTLLRVVESGFDAIPASRRDEAYRSNEGGWAEQMQAIARYLDEAR
jgi:uncharacterized protein YndB with AHSA1/START domain